MDVFAFIPARYGSTRFPGKPLALIADSLASRLSRYTGNPAQIMEFVFDREYYAADSTYRAGNIVAYLPGTGAVPGWRRAQGVGRKKLREQGRLGHGSGSGLPPEPGEEWDQAFGLLWPGQYQVRVPRSLSTAGTSIMRTRVASSATARARSTPAARAS